jgi:hypothetical protein
MVQLMSHLALVTNFPGPHRRASAKSTGPVGIGIAIEIAIVLQRKSNVVSTFRPITMPIAKLAADLAGALPGTGRSLKAASRFSSVSGAPGRYGPAKVA